ncbi:hypothetical protein Taro_023307 [Colocasia esculenta]|uniref:Uncharacterized protein n=1 Tax=Colocasia esculenta TaxID=4460 RepID=A0A843V622_COLES|nr:hypothetical protein [Colocasia esculenta]
MAAASTTTSLFTPVAEPFLLSRWPKPSPAAASSYFCAALPKSLPSRRSAALRVTAVAQKWEPSKVAPQGDRVLVRLEELPEKSSGGVLLPKSAVKFERYLMGEILSLGSDVGELEAGKKDMQAFVPICGTGRPRGICIWGRRSFILCEGQRLS